MKHRRFFKQRDASSINLLRHELIEAMQEPGCALCGLAQRKSLRYVETLLESAVIDVEQRDDWRHAGGFCEPHAAMAITVVNSAGSLAILYEDAFQHELVHLAQLIPHPKNSWWQRRRQRLVQRVQHWLQMRQRRSQCPICRSWQAQEQLYMAVLLDHAEDDGVIHTLSQSDGLCMPHIASLLQFDASHSHLGAVLAAEYACLERLHGDLKEFNRKQDYRYAHESYGREADAWQRVVACFVGGWYRPRQ